VWAPRGGAVYYRAPSGDLMTVKVTADASGAPRFSAPQALFRLLADDNADGRHYQVTPDERHVVLLHSVGGVKRDLMLVENFVEMLARRGWR
jgi:hypothetical protein